MNIGNGGVYIKDHGFDHLVDIPKEVALKWVQSVLPEHTLGQGDLKAKDMTAETMDADPEGWLNKYFVVVGASFHNWIALYNHDGTYSIRTKKDAKCNDV